MYCSSCKQDGRRRVNLNTYPGRLNIHLIRPKVVSLHGPVQWCLRSTNIYATQLLINASYKSYVRIEGQRVQKGNILPPFTGVLEAEKILYMKHANIMVVGGVVGSIIQIV